MADGFLNQYLARGTAAERAAFTPAPPTVAVGPESGYVWHETDTGLSFAWNGSDWDRMGDPATMELDDLGDVEAPSPTEGDFLQFGGSPDAWRAVSRADADLGYLGAPQMSDQDDYTLVMADAGKHYYHVSGTPHTLTIPANASVAFPIGTVIVIVNENGGGDLTIAITSDTLRWTDQTGSRTLAADGTATLIKVTSTVWRLTGDGIT